jgi:hypothetical protein
MQQTANADKTSLTHLDAQIVEARKLASAELAFQAANGDSVSNPWAGSKERLDNLAHEREQLRLRIQGEQISKALTNLKMLETELEGALEERRVADHNLRVLSESASVVKWKAATAIAMRLGYGHSLHLYQEWILSGKSRTYAPECILFFETQGPEELRFSESEREAVRKWNQAKGESNVALSRWSSVAERRAALLRERPELAKAS